MYQAELVHDGEAFNFWFHSPLEEGTGAKPNSSHFPREAHTHFSVC